MVLHCLQVFNSRFVKYAEVVFAQTSPIVTSMLDGYNVCIFALIPLNFERNRRWFINQDWKPHYWNADPLPPKTHFLQHRQDKVPVFDPFASYAGKFLKFFLLNLIFKFWSNFRVIRIRGDFTKEPFGS